MELFNNRMFSYFYTQSFYKRFNRYPFWEYSHWIEWIFERIYEEEKVENINKIVDINLWKEMKNIISNFVYIKWIEKNLIKDFKSENALKWYYKLKKLIKNPILNF